jgi:uncharacterized protein (DUF1697 family)
MNAKMPELKRAFERAGWQDVKTVLSSGNVLFSTKAASRAALERKCEAAMEASLPRSFSTTVRSIDELRALLDSDPFAGTALKPGSKRVVTFMKDKPKAALELPIDFEGARIWSVRGTEAFCTYVPGPRGPVFMTLLEKTFGKTITTRTWETVGKLAR